MNIRMETRRDFVRLTGTVALAAALPVHGTAAPNRPPLPFPPVPDATERPGISVAFGARALRDPSGVADYLRNPYLRPIGKPFASRQPVNHVIASGPGI